MRNVITLTILALLSLGGCNQNHNDQAAATAKQPEASASVQATTQQASMQMSPEQLGELGAQIEKTPDRANDLLTQHGLTPQSFESQIRKITENPDESKRYAAAYRKARG